MFSFSLSGLQLLIFFIQPPLYNSVFLTKGILSAISRNGLLYFLVANLVTGFVNICLNSLNQSYRFSSVQEILFLIIYLLFITLFIVFVNKKHKKKE